MTRIPDGDLNRYIIWNEFAQEVSLLAYLQSFLFREFLFHMLTYTISNVSWYSIEIYLFVLVSMTYFFIVLSILKFSYIMEAKVISIFSIIIFVSVWGPVLSLSTQVIRQMMAGSLFLYMLVDYMEKKEVNILLFIAPIFFHFSAIFMLVLFLICRMRYRLISVLLVFLGLLTVRVLGNYFISIPLLGPLVFSRIVDLNRGAKLDALGLTELTLLVAITFVALLVNTRLKGFHIRFLSNLTVLTALSIFVFSVIGAHEMAVRFFFYIYFLMFALLPCVTTVFKPERLVSGGLLMLGSLSFVNSILLGEWSYEMHFLPIILPALGLL
ncbi:EpsG family protein [Paracoccaceae bacterium]|nr:EpsG family protein [Paracoccaceae bacterium]